MLCRQLNPKTEFVVVAYFRSDRPIMCHDNFFRKVQAKSRSDVFPVGGNVWLKYSIQRAWEIKLFWIEVVFQKDYDSF